MTTEAATDSKTASNSSTPVKIEELMILKETKLIADPKNTKYHVHFSFVIHYEMEPLKFKIMKKEAKDLELTVEQRGGGKCEAKKLYTTSFDLAKSLGDKNKWVPPADHHNDVKKSMPPNKSGAIIRNIVFSLVTIIAVYNFWSLLFW